jgi:transposase
MLLRFVDGQPCGAITTQFLAWLCGQLAEDGVSALLLIWDNASWHKSHAVRAWIKAHNYLVKRQASRVRILPFLLPVKSPWLNPIEPKWLHGKRAVVEPDRTLPALELAERVCLYFDCSHDPHLSIP